MIRRLLASLVLLAITRCAAHAENGRSLSNLDFEQGVVGEVPFDWSVRSAVRYGYRVVTSDERPHGGTRSGLIQRDSVGSFRDAGVVAKKIDARPYRGKRVMLTGWARYVGPPGLPYFGTMQMYLRVDRPGDLIGFFDNMEDRPVRSEV